MTTRNRTNPNKFTKRDGKVLVAVFGLGIGMAVLAAILIQVQSIFTPAATEDTTPTTVEVAPEVETPALELEETPAVEADETVTPGAEVPAE